MEFIVYEYTPGGLNQFVLIGLSGPKSFINLDGRSLRVIFVSYEY